MKNKIYYVYQLISSNDEIFYIGKGSGNRMYQHVSIAMGKSISRTKNLKLYNKIKKIIDSGGFIKCEIIFKSENENDCFNEEIRLIEKIGLINLCNLTIGGEGTSGYKLSEETKLKMSLAKKDKKRENISKIHKENLLKNPQIFKIGHDGYWNGKTLSEETKLKMSLAKKGRKFSKEHKEKISQSLKGRELSETHKNNIKKSKTY
jgi:hypothetical protein